MRRLCHEGRAASAPPAFSSALYLRRSAPPAFSLKIFNTPGKLKNFPHSKDDINAQKAHLDSLRKVEELAGLAKEITPLTSYLAAAEVVFPAEADWTVKAREQRSNLIANYTTCPNPFIEDFIKEHSNPYDADNDSYHREPFAVDVSEGKMILFIMPTRIIQKYRIRPSCATSFINTEPGGYRV